MRSATLILLAGDHPGRTFRIDDEALIGRGAGAAVHLLRSDVSRQHARIWRDRSGVYQIEDLGSHNGTRVNGVPVHQSALAFGDKIAVGAGTMLLFTERDALEEQLLLSQKLESLGRLAGALVHDYQNLLSASLTNLDFLRMLPEDTTLSKPVVESALRDTEGALRRAIEMTRRLQGFVNRDRIEDQPTNLSSVTGEVASLIQRTVHRTISVETSIENDVIVAGDPRQLQQVVTHLCLNAVDAMPDGGVVVVRVAKGEAGGPGTHLLVAEPHAIIEVADSGRGLDDVQRRAVFEPTLPQPGRGLGLAMVYSVVKSHGGDVQLDTAPGAGCLVRVVLPRVDATGPISSSPTDDHTAVASS